MILSQEQKSGQFVKERLRLLQVGRVEALGEPIVDRGKQVAGLTVLVLTLPKPSERYRGSDFPLFGRLISRNGECRTECNFGFAFSGQCGIDLAANTN